MYDVGLGYCICNIIQFNLNSFCRSEDPWKSSQIQSTEVTYCAPYQCDARAMFVMPLFSRQTAPYDALKFNVVGSISVTKLREENMEVGLFPWRLVRQNAHLSGDHSFPKVLHRGTGATDNQAASRRRLGLGHSLLLIFVQCSGTRLSQFIWRLPYQSFEWIWGHKFENRQVGYLTDHQLNIKINLTSKFCHVI